MINRKKIISASLIICMAVLVAASGQTEKKIPDYSSLDRHDVPDIVKWSIEDIYPSVEEWEKDKEIAREQIGQTEE